MLGKHGYHLTLLGSPRQCWAAPGTIDQPWSVYYNEVLARAEKLSELVSLGLCLSVLGSLWVSVPEAMRRPGGALWEQKLHPAESPIAAGSAPSRAFRPPPLAVAAPGGRRCGAWAG